MIIQLKNSQQAGNQPTNLTAGEVGINEEDGILYYRNTNGSSKALVWSGGTFTGEVAFETDVSISTTTTTGGLTISGIDGPALTLHDTSSAGGGSRIWEQSSSIGVGRLFIDADFNAAGTGSEIIFRVDGTPKFYINEEGQLVSNDPTTALAHYTFDNDTDTGIGSGSGNAVDIISGGKQNTRFNLYSDGSPQQRNYTYSGTFNAGRWYDTQTNTGLTIVTFDGNYTPSTVSSGNPGASGSAINYNGTSRFVVGTTSATDLHLIANKITKLRVTESEGILLNGVTNVDPSPNAATHRLILDNEISGPTATERGIGGQTANTDLLTNKIKLFSSSYGASHPTFPNGYFYYGIGITSSQLNVTSGPGSVAITTRNYQTAVFDDAKILVQQQSNGTPNYSFWGDINTGMGSDGPDQILFTTGGVQRVRIDEEGNRIYGGNVNLRTNDPTNIWSGYNIHTQDAAQGGVIEFRTQGVEKFNFISTSSQAKLRTSDAIPLRIGTDYQDRIDIDEDGKVFIYPAVNNKKTLVVANGTLHFGNDLYHHGEATLTNSINGAGITSGQFITLNEEDGVTLKKTRVYCIEAYIDTTSTKNGCHHLIYWNGTTWVNRVVTSTAPDGIQSQPTTYATDNHLRMEIVSFTVTDSEGNVTTHHKVKIFNNHATYGYTFYYKVHAQATMAQGPPNTLGADFHSQKFVDYDTTKTVVSMPYVMVSDALTGVSSSGTAERPALTFYNDIDTGLYSNSTGQISFTSNGEDFFRIGRTPATPVNQSFKPFVVGDFALGNPYDSTLESLFSAAVNNYGETLLEAGRQTYFVTSIRGRFYDDVYTDSTGATVSSILRYGVAQSCLAEAFVGRGLTNTGYYKGADYTCHVRVDTSGAATGRADVSTVYGGRYVAGVYHTDAEDIDVTGKVVGVEAVAINFSHAGTVAQAYGVWSQVHRQITRTGAGEFMQGQVRDGPIAQGFGLGVRGVNATKAYGIYVDGINATDKRDAYAIYQYDTQANNVFKGPLFLGADKPAAYTTPNQLADVQLRVDSGSKTYGIFADGDSTTEHHLVGRVYAGDSGGSPSTSLHVKGAVQPGRGHLFVEDVASYATGVGGVIGLGGKYNSSSTEASFGQVAGVKANAIDGNYSGKLALRTQKGVSPYFYDDVVIHNGKMQVGYNGNGGTGWPAGQTDPQALLHFANIVAQEGIPQSTDAARGQSNHITFYDATNGRIGIGVSNSSWNFSTNGLINYRFWVQDDEAMRLSYEKVLHVNSAAHYKESASTTLNATERPLLSLANRLNDLSTSADRANQLRLYTENVTTPTSNCIGLGTSAGAFVYEAGDNAHVFYTSDTERARITSAGLVGVNETTPVGQVHIKNPSGTTGFVIARAAYKTSTTLQVAVDSTRAVFDAYNDGFLFRCASLNGLPPSHKMRIKGNGNVGIGQLQPSAKLDVNGDAKCRTQLDIGGVRPLILSAGSQGIASEKQASAGGWVSAHTHRGYDPVASAVDPTTNPNGDTFGTNFGGFGWFGNNDSLNYYFIGPSYVSTDTIVLKNGDVGIGTLTPQKRLHVEGSAQFGLDPADANYAPAKTQLTVNGNRPITFFGGNNNTGNDSASEKHAGTEGGWAFTHKAIGNQGTNRGGFGWYGTGDALNHYFIGVTYDSDESFYVKPNGNVNIGTPDATTRKLTIKGGASDNSGAVLIKGKDVGTGSSNGFLLSASHLGEASVWNFEQQPIIFGIQQTEAFRIDANRNIGIGTNNPTYKLDVEGSARLNAGNAENVVAIANSGSILVQTQGAKYTSTANACRYQNNKGPFIVNNYYDGSTPVDTDSVLQINNRSNGLAQTIDFTTGTVQETADQAVRWASISKPSTSHGLEYRMYAGTNPVGYAYRPSHQFFTVKHSDSAGTQYQTLKMSYDETTIYTDGVERVYVDVDGNVGIGTNSPTHKLEVTGGGVRHKHTASTSNLANQTRTTITCDSGLAGGFTWAGLEIREGGNNGNNSLSHRYVFADGGLNGDYQGQFRVERQGLAANFHAIVDLQYGTQSADRHEALRIKKNQIVVPDPDTNSNGSLIPQYSFASDTNTGMYWEAADQLYLVVGGYKSVSINSSHKVFFRSDIECAGVIENTTNASTVSILTSTTGANQTKRVTQDAAANPCTFWEGIDNGNWHVGHINSSGLFEKLFYINDTTQNAYFKYKLGVGAVPSGSAMLEVHGDVEIVAGELKLGGPVTEKTKVVTTAGATQTIALSAGTHQDYTLTSNCTFTMPTPVAGQSFTVLIRTGTGNRTATFTQCKWPADLVPSTTTTANRMDIHTFVSDGVNWYGNVQQDYQS